MFLKFLKLKMFFNLKTIKTHKNFSKPLKFLKPSKLSQDECYIIVVYGVF